MSESNTILLCARAAVNNARRVSGEAPRSFDDDKFPFFHMLFRPILSSRRQIDILSAFSNVVNTRSNRGTGWPSSRFLQEIDGGWGIVGGAMGVASSIL